MASYALALSQDDTKEMLDGVLQHDTPRILEDEGDDGKEEERMSKMDDNGVPHAPEMDDALHATWWKDGNTREEEKTHDNGTVMAMMSQTSADRK